MTTISRSTVRLNVSRYSTSSNIFWISLQLLPMFWIGCERSWTRPAAMRPNIACRSCFRTSSCSCTMLSAIELNESPSCFSSSWPVIVTRSSKRPSAMASVARRSAKMRVRNDRPHSQPTTIVPSSARADDQQSASAAIRRAAAKASDVGCSTTTIQCRSGIGAATRTISSPSSSWYCVERTDVSCSVATFCGERSLAARQGDQPLLVRVAVGHEPVALGEQRGPAVLADSDAVDHPPQLFEGELADDAPRSTFAERDRHAIVVVGRRVVVEVQRRHVDVFRRLGCLRAPTPSGR